ncbi:MULTISPECIES: CAP domain-containing protein [unclassified Butyrivibrio]|uniref:CAP domain-containing protein n=1 Tax=unclassified Butyrivibrio TaxID=2639466 RepID=UPI0003FE9A01|nr:MULTISPECIES: CAP domain-containing protein [unclassified Butyrivibrio]
MKKFRRAIATLVAVVFSLNVMACGEKQVATIDDVAALRGINEDIENIYIDDEAIALAGEITSSEGAVAAAQAAFALVNQKRAASGLGQLQWSDSLTQAALVRAQEIVGTFSHNRPDGSPWYTVNSNIMFGENLAKLYNTGDSVVAAWMASPTHAANIMEAGFKTVGIAVFQAGNGNWYWAQEFGY